MQIKIILIRFDLLLLLLFCQNRKKGKIKGSFVIPALTKMAKDFAYTPSKSFQGTFLHITHLQMLPSLKKSFYIFPKFFLVC